MRYSGGQRNYYLSLPGIEVVLALVVIIMVMIIIVMATNIYWTFNVSNIVLSYAFVLPNLIFIKILQVTVIPV